MRRVPSLEVGFAAAKDAASAMNVGARTDCVLALAAVFVLGADHDAVMHSDRHRYLDARDAWMVVISLPPPLASGTSLSPLTPPD